MLYPGMSMRRLALLVCLLLLLPGCYQVEGEPVATAAARRVGGVRDGLYRRPDGVEVTVRWNAAQRQYDIESTVGPGGTARAAPLGGRFYLVQYQDAARLSLLAAMDGDDVVLYAPAKAAERRLATAHGLTLRAGPIPLLGGKASEVAAFFQDMATSGEFAEGGRLVFLK